MFTEKDCIRSMYAPAPNDSNAGLVAILKPEILAPEYRKPEFQLFRLAGGFGTSPSKIGNACIGRFCVDGECCREERYNFIGIANETVTKYAEELEAQWKEEEGQ